MDQKMPQSLLMISQVTPEELRRTQNVDLIMVKGLWQAFLVSRRASESQADRRLEYLFWRIWSSESLLTEMKVGRLNDLVSRIILPTGQTGKPPTKQARKSRAQPEYHPITGSPSYAVSQPVSQPEMKPQPTEAKAMPQPILKKSSAPQGESNKTTRLLLEQPDGGSITRNPSHSPTLSLNENENEPQPREYTPGRQAPKKSQFASGIRSGRRRPLFNRRKSSQVSVTKPTASPSSEQQPPPQPQKTQPLRHPPADPLESMSSFELVFDPDYVPPIQDSPPATTPTHTQENIELAKIKEALADIGSIEIPRLSSSKTATATTTAAATSNVSEADTLLSQGLETVSHEPQETHFQTGDHEKQRAESQDPSLFSNGIAQLFDSYPVPGFPGLLRIPMPEKMENTLLGILNDDSPLDGLIPLPTRPWWMCEHAWSPVPRKEYLKEWMLVSEEWDKQPTTTPLSHPEFRTRFVEAVAAARAEEEAAIAFLNEVRVPTLNGRASRTDNESEKSTSYFSGISHMVGNESQESRSARAEDLEWERKEEQPDHQEKQKVVWHGTGSDCIFEKSPFAIALEQSAHSLDPPSW
ncbi:hypothetical protein N7481_013028 [Penicillium waksmanii]|uniref:uncharacterized protein n=1 Tax=Penicillium waksmanii TaxID=69791 RepID=UPI002547FE46|nr:uncharacterized protein N7481_013028 [Penicillium waksmanii]KAJ5966314.1 hypothetical protein N7481_013028 [Penicillium waksmanii]